MTKVCMPFSSSTLLTPNTTALNEMKARLKSLYSAQVQWHPEHRQGGRRRGGTPTGTHGLSMCTTDNANNTNNSNNKTFELIDTILSNPATDARTMCRFLAITKIASDTYTGKRMRIASKILNASRYGGVEEGEQILLFDEKLRYNVNVTKQRQRAQLAILDWLSKKPSGQKLSLTYNLDDSQMNMTLTITNDGTLEFYLGQMAYDERNQTNELPWDNTNDGPGKETYTTYEDLEDLEDHTGMPLSDWKFMIESLFQEGVGVNGGARLQKRIRIPSALRTHFKVPAKYTGKDAIDFIIKNNDKKTIASFAKAPQTTSLTKHALVMKALK